MAEDKRWFDVNPSWDLFLKNFKPKKILEIGCFSGQTTCNLIEKLAPEGNFEIYCVDPWEDYDEPNGSDMKSIENQFDKNTIASAKKVRDLGVDLTVIKFKAHSWAALPDLLAQGKRNYFDFVYIDGSHKAADVLFDAVFSFELTKLGGVIIFDDYIWSEVFIADDGLPWNNLSRSPKIAIDGFTSAYFDKLKLINSTTSQLCAQKVAY